MVERRYAIPYNMLTLRDLPRLGLRLKNRLYPGHFASQVYPLVRNETMLPYEALYSLWNAVRSVVARGIPGCAVECGVAKGGSGAVLGRALLEFDANRRLFCFDTFEGLPPPTDRDPDYDLAVNWTGKCRGTIEEVEAFFRRLGLTEYQLIRGRFQETVPARITNLISVLHLDVV
jgi:O-methyltransferase